MWTKHVEHLGQSYVHGVVTQGWNSIMIDGESFKGGKFTALAYENHVRTERMKWDEDCRKMDVALKRFAKGAIAGNLGIVAPGGTLTDR